MVTMLHWFYALAQFALGVLLLHRAVPTVLCEGRWRAFKIWFLGAALAVFAGGNLVSALYGVNNHWINMAAQGLLLCYGTLRYRHIVRGGVVHWSDAA